MGKRRIIQIVKQAGKKDQVIIKSQSTRTPEQPEQPSVAELRRAARSEFVPRMPPISTRAGKLR